MKGESALLTLEVGGLPVPNPSTAAEDARLASLISLDGILTQVKVSYIFHVVIFIDKLITKDMINE